MAKKLAVLIVVVSYATLLSACSGPDEGSTVETVSTAAAGTVVRPAKIANSYEYGGGECYVDSSNPPAVANLLATSRKLPFRISGWAIAGVSRRTPVPPLVFAVLKGDKGVFYLEGQHKPRPDIAAAKGGRAFDQAGYEISVNTLAIPAGDYQLSIAIGSEFVLGMCPTKMVVRVGD